MATLPALAPSIAGRAPENAVRAAASAGAVRRPASRFLVSPAFDLGLLVLSPLWALALGALLAPAPAVPGTGAGAAPGLPSLYVVLALAVLESAHQCATLARTHGNARVFRRHPLRFTLVPALLLGLLLASPGARAVAVVVAVVWDVRHSGLQTFGLLRLYHRIAGGDPRAGRGLDRAMSHLVHAGPVLAGAGFLLYLSPLYALRRLGHGALASIPEAARNLRPALGVAVIAIALPLVLAWVVARARRARRGEPVAWPALALVAATATASVASFGFDAFGQALLTMKTFHGVQYLALLSRSEGDAIAASLGRPQGSVSKAAAIALIAPPALAYGVFGALTHRAPDASAAATSLVLTVTLLHFWFDGFIWSVRRGDV